MKNLVTKFSGYVLLLIGAALLACQMVSTPSFREELPIGSSLKGGTKDVVLLPAGTEMPTGGVLVGTQPDGGTLVVDLPDDVTVTAQPNGGTLVVEHPARRGAIETASDVATATGAAGMPYAGLVGGGLSIIGTILAFFTGRKDKKLTIQSAVDLFEKLKPKIELMRDDEDLKAFLESNAETGKFAAEIKALYDKLHDTEKKAQN